MDSGELLQLQEELNGRCDAIAAGWHEAIGHLYYTSHSPETARQSLVELTGQVITLFCTEPFDHDGAQALGASLTNLSVEPEVLAQTQRVLTRQLVAGLPADQVAALQPRLAELLGGLGAGFFQHAGRRILNQQEQIRRALVSELQRRGEALRRSRDELEQQVQERTAELAATNAQLKQEIAERKQVEEMLRESEQMARALVNTPTDYAMLIDANGIILDCNETIAQRFGKQTAELIGLNVFDLLPPNVRERRTRCYNEIMQTAESVRFEDEREGIWFDNVCHPILDAQGKVTKIAVLARNITPQKQITAALQESEARYRSLFEDSPLSLWEVDLSQVKAYFNDLRASGITDLRTYFQSHPEAVVQWVGLTRVLDINKSTLALLEAGNKAEVLAGFANVFMEGSLETYREALLALDEGDQKFESETVLRTFTGEEKFVNVRLSVAPCYEDSLGKVLASLLDLTGHKQAEEALRESEELHRITMENISDPVFITDDEGKFTFICANVPHLLGYSMEELQALGDISKLVGEDLFNLEELENLGEIHNIEREIVNKYGQARVYLITVKRVSIGRGTILHTWRDITDRKRMQEALRESETKYRLLTETAFEGIAVSEKGRYLEVSPRFAALFGYQPTEIIGMYAADLIAPEVRDEFMAKILSGYDRPYETLCLRKDGSTFPADVCGKNYPSQGRDLRITAIRDITKRKRAEEVLQKHRDHLEELVKERTAELEAAKERAEAANRAKSAFLATMSHELRTPLNAILGYAQIFLRRPLDADLIDGLNTVQRSGQHLLTLINDILDFSKIEADQMELSLTSIHFPVFLEHIVDIIQARAEAKGLVFSFEATGPLPRGVHADEIRLRQVLLNLLDNAVKFTEVGQVTLRVGSREYEVRSKGEKQRGEPLLPTPYSLLRFEVEDTGIGIAPDQLEHIFQPFEQIEEVLYHTKGTGLGLAISRQLVRLMGGELYVESPSSMGGGPKGGPGSLFWFELTLSVTAWAVDAASLQPSEQFITSYRGPRCRVLVVDDIASNRAVVVDLLQPLGFEVFEAADGQQAIQLAQEIQPDLILMDRWLPVLDGFEAARQLRQIPALAEVPTIAISASVSAEDQAQSREAGIDAFLPKPVNWPNLAALLEEHLKLEWEYDTKDEGGGRKDEAEIHPSSFRLHPSELVPPPQEEMAVLYDLTLRGNMRAIRERAAHLKTLGEQYVPFANRLLELARGFEEKEILRLVEQYIDKEE